MEKKDKIILIILTFFYSITLLSKVSLYLNKYSTTPIMHHTNADAATCAEKVLTKAKMYEQEVKIKCACKTVNNTDYYKYTCDCINKKKKDNNLLQSGGSRILYEEKDTYRLKYNFWINENDWYTGYCDN